jgi:hypothetical protein
VKAVACFDSIGFDTDQKLTQAQALRLWKAGFRFVIRYVGIGQNGPEDLDAAEYQMLLSIGFYVMIVQHVLDPNWTPSQQLGQAHGVAAMRNAQSIGYASGAHIWTDLEGCRLGTSASAVIDYVNAEAAVIKKTNRAGLYRGFQNLLTPQQAYQDLGVDSYWLAPGVQEVAVRGSAIFQKVEDFQFGDVLLDIDVMKADLKGEYPIAAAA